MNEPKDEQFEEWLSGFRMGQETTNSFLTGSQVYGFPDSTSDVDLVVKVSPEELHKLMLLDEEYDEDYHRRYGGSDGFTASLRFGKLNLICVAKIEDYLVWKNGTQELKEKAPVTREVAVECFKRRMAESGGSS